MILVTGASGNVGSYIIKGLINKGAKFKAALRSISEAPQLNLSPDQCIEFDFSRPETFAEALTGAERVFLMRPPAMSDVKKGIGPFIEASQKARVKQIVFLSLLGAEKNPLVPHHKIENLILKSGIPYTFLRPSFFMQNLSTTHRSEIIDLNEILVPAGHGKTSFIDVRDIADIAVLALTEPGHETRAYPLTGSESLSYGEIAQILTEELGRKISYSNPSILRFTLYQRRKGTPWTFIVVMIGIYTIAKLGKADTITDDLEKLLGRKPIRFRQFAKEHRHVWTK